MSVFEDQGPTAGPNKKSIPWPTRLLMKLGLGESAANGAVIVVALAVIILATMNYFSVTGADNKKSENVLEQDISAMSSDEIRDILNSGFDTDILTDQTKEDLRLRGFNIN